jgi:hypothetical protein
MRSPKELASHRATAETGAAFTATREGGFAMLTPIAPRAEA